MKSLKKSFVSFVFLFFFIFSSAQTVDVKDSVTKLEGSLGQFIKSFDELSKELENSKNSFSAGDLDALAKESNALTQLDPKVLIVDDQTDAWKKYKDFWAKLDQLQTKVEDLGKQYATEPVILTTVKSAMTSRFQDKKNKEEEIAVRFRLVFTPKLKKLEEKLAEENSSSLVIGSYFEDVVEDADKLGEKVIHLGLQKLPDYVGYEQKKKELQDKIQVRAQAEEIQGEDYQIKNLDDGFADLLAEIELLPETSVEEKKKKEEQLNEVQEVIAKVKEKVKKEKKIDEVKLTEKLENVQKKIQFIQDPPDPDKDFAELKPVLIKVETREESKWKELEDLGDLLEKQKQLGKNVEALVGEVEVVSKLRGSGIEKAQQDVSTLLQGLDQKPVTEIASTLARTEFQTLENAMKPDNLKKEGLEVTGVHKGQADAKKQVLLRKKQEIDQKVQELKTKVEEETKKEGAALDLFKTIKKDKETLQTDLSKISIEGDVPPETLVKFKEAWVKAGAHKESLDKLEPNLGTQKPTDFGTIKVDLDKILKTKVDEENRTKVKFGEFVTQIAQLEEALESEEVSKKKAPEAVEDGLKLVKENAKKLKERVQTLELTEIQGAEQKNYEEKLKALEEKIKSQKEAKVQQVTTVTNDLQIIGTAAGQVHAKVGQVVPGVVLKGQISSLEKIKEELEEQERKRTEKQTVVTGLNDPTLNEAFTKLQTDIQTKKQDVEKRITELTKQQQEAKSELDQLVKDFTTLNQKKLVDESNDVLEKYLISQDQKEISTAKLKAGRERLKAKIDVTALSGIEQLEVKIKDAQQKLRKKLEEEAQQKKTIVVQEEKKKLEAKLTPIEQKLTTIPQEKDLEKRLEALNQVLVEIENVKTDGLKKLEGGDGPAGAIEKQKADLEQLIGGLIANISTEKNIKLQLEALRSQFKDEKIEKTDEEKERLKDLLLDLSVPDEQIKFLEEKKVDVSALNKIKTDLEKDINQELTNIKEGKKVEVVQPAKKETKEPEVKEKEGKKVETKEPEVKEDVSKKVEKKEEAKKVLPEYVNKNIEGIKTALEKHPDLLTESLDSQGNTLLDLAVSESDISLMFYLLKTLDEKKIPVKIKDESKAENVFKPIIQLALGKTPANKNALLHDLMRFIAIGTWKSSDFEYLSMGIKYLIDKGIKINQQVNEGTPLDTFVEQLAVYRKKTYSQEIFLELFKELVTTYKAEGSKKDTLFGLVAWHGWNEAAQFLILEKGDDVNQQLSRGETPLLRAINQRHHDVALTLIQSQNIKVDIQEEGTKKTPLHIVCEQGKGEDLIDELLKKGANPLVKDLEGNTPLHVACEKGFVYAVDELLKAKGNLESKNKKEETPRGIVEKKLKQYEGYKKKYDDVNERMKLYASAQEPFEEKDYQDLGTSKEKYEEYVAFLKINQLFEQRFPKFSTILKKSIDKEVADVTEMSKILEENPLLVKVPFTEGGYIPVAYATKNKKYMAVTFFVETFPGKKEKFIKQEEETKYFEAIQYILSWRHKETEENIFHCIAQSDPTSITTFNLLEDTYKDGFFGRLIAGERGIPQNMLRELTQDMMSPIHIAAVNNNEKAVKFFVSFFDKPGDITNIKSQKSMTPLHYACSYKSLDVVELLLEKGADVNAEAQGKGGQVMTPLDIVAEKLGALEGQKKTEVQEYLDFMKIRKELRKKGAIAKAFKEQEGQRVLAEQKKEEDEKRRQDKEELGEIVDNVSAIGTILSTEENRNKYEKEPEKSISELIEYLNYYSVRLKELSADFDVGELPEYIASLLDAERIREQKEAEVQALLSEVMDKLKKVGAAGNKFEAYKSLKQHEKENHFNVLKDLKLELEAKKGESALASPLKLVIAFLTQILNFDEELLQEKFEELNKRFQTEGATEEVKKLVTPLGDLVKEVLEENKGDEKGTFEKKIKESTITKEIPELRAQVKELKGKIEKRVQQEKEKMKAEERRIQEAKEKKDKAELELMRLEVRLGSKIELKILKKLKDEATMLKNQVTSEKVEGVDVQGFIDKVGNQITTTIGTKTTALQQELKTLQEAAKTPLTSVQLKDLRSKKVMSFLRNLKEFFDSLKALEKAKTKEQAKIFTDLTALLEKIKARIIVEIAKEAKREKLEREKKEELSGLVLEFGKVKGNLETLIEFKSKVKTFNDLVVAQKLTEVKSKELLDQVTQQIEMLIQKEQSNLQSRSSTLIGNIGNAAEQGVLNTYKGNAAKLKSDVDLWLANIKGIDPKFSEREGIGNTIKQNLQKAINDKQGALDKVRIEAEKAEAQAKKEAAQAKKAKRKLMIKLGIVFQKMKFPYKIVKNKLQSALGGWEDSGGIKVKAARLKMLHEVLGEIKNLKISASDPIKKIEQTLRKTYSKKFSQYGKHVAGNKQVGVYRKAISSALASQMKR